MLLSLLSESSACEPWFPFLYDSSLGKLKNEHIERAWHGSRCSEEIDIGSFFP